MARSTRLWREFSAGLYLHLFPVVALRITLLIVISCILFVLFCEIDS